MCQMVAYKRLKTMKNYNIVTSKSSRARLREVVAYKRLSHIEGSTEGARLKAGLTSYN